MNTHPTIGWQPIAGISYAEALSRFSRRGGHILQRTGQLTITVMGTDGLSSSGYPTGRACLRRDIVLPPGSSGRTSIRPCPRHRGLFKVSGEPWAEMQDALGKVKLDITAMLNRR